MFTHVELLNLLKKRTTLTGSELAPINERIRVMVNNRPTHVLNHVCTLCIQRKRLKKDAKLPPTPGTYAEVTPEDVLLWLNTLTWIPVLQLNNRYAPTSEVVYYSSVTPIPGRVKFAPNTDFTRTATFDVHQEINTRNTIYCSAATCSYGLPIDTTDCILVTRKAKTEDSDDWFIDRLVPGRAAATALVALTTLPKNNPKTISALEAEDLGITSVRLLRSDERIWS